MPAVAVTWYDYCRYGLCFEIFSLRRGERGGKIVGDDLTSPRRKKDSVLMQRMCGMDMRWCSSFS